jgi:hypothetical protein
VREEIISTFGLFPNPAREYVQLTGLQKSSLIEITDAQGKLALSLFGSGDNRTINIQNLSNGYYTVRETSEGIIRSGTLLVNH